MHFSFAFWLIVSLDSALRIPGDDRKRSWLLSGFAGVRPCGTPGLITVRGRRVAAIRLHLRRRIGRARGLTTFGRLPSIATISIFDMIMPLRTCIDAGRCLCYGRLPDCRLCRCDPHLLNRCPTDIVRWLVMADRSGGRLRILPDCGLRPA